MTALINIKKDGDIVRDEKMLVELFNENYVNIVEISSGINPSSLGNFEDSAQDGTTVDKIISNTVHIPVFKKLKGNFL